MVHVLRTSIVDNIVAALVVPVAVAVKRLSKDEYNARKQGLGILACLGCSSRNFVFMYPIVEREEFIYVIIRRCDYDLHGLVQNERYVRMYVRMYECCSLLIS